MTVAGMIMGHKPKLGGFIAAISIFLLVWVFGPSLIWSQNPGEFNFGIKDLLPQLLDWRVGFAFVAIGLSTMLLPERVYRFGFALLFAVFLIALIEFNFFQGERALVGNEAEGVNISTAGQWLPIVAYVAILAASLLGRRYLGGWTVAALVVFGLGQSAMIAIAPTVDKPETIDFDKLTAFSSSRNIIQLILDEAQSSLVLEVLEGRFPGYEKKLAGFTFYQNALGLYPTTKTAVGYFFTDKLWENKRPIQEWRKESLNGNMFQDLASDGYDVDVVSFPSFTAEKSTPNKRIVGIPVPFAGVTSAKRIGDEKQVEAALLVGLSISRVIPDSLKALLSISDNRGNDYLLDRLRANIAFFDEVTNLAHVDGAQPRYKLLHFVTTHNPAAVDADCTVLRKPNPGLYRYAALQTECGLSQLIAFLDKLRAIGAYDNSTIIIHADHGKRVAIDAPYHLANHFGRSYPDGLAQVIASGLPTLMIKPAGASGDMTISDAPVWYKDIPATVRKEAGIPLSGEERSILAPAPDRPRFFYYYPYAERGNGFNERLIKYRVSGPAWDPNSWSKETEFLEPNRDYSPGRIDMGTADARRFERDYWRPGVGKGGATVGFTIGPEADLAYEFKDKRDYKLTIDMYPTVQNQSVEISVNGDPIGGVQFQTFNPRAYTLQIPAEAVRKGMSTIEIKLARFNDKPSRENAIQSQHGLAVDWIEVK